LCIDALRICIPSLIEIAGLISYLALLYVSYRFLPMPLFLGSAPFITFIIFLASALAVVGVKSLLIGAFTPIIKPLWSPFVWLNEVVNGAYEAISAPIMSLFFGTPFIAWYLRLLGCKIGKHTFIETALFGEFDLVEIGDYAALNNNTIVQNHLFEDRIFKASTLKIGDECSIGNMSVVLYDSEMKQGSSIGPLSLLMKSEILPPFTRWTGIPVEAEGSNANDR
jgi:non-ribosomal peptide synthetase-like protein